MKDSMIMYMYYIVQRQKNIGPNVVTYTAIRMYCKCHDSRKPDVTITKVLMIHGFMLINL